MPEPVATLLALPARWAVAAADIAVTRWGSQVAHPDRAERERHIASSRGRG